LGAPQARLTLRDRRDANPFSLQFSRAFSGQSPRDHEMRTRNPASPPFQAVGANRLGVSPTNLYEALRPRPLLPWCWTIGSRGGKGDVRKIADSFAMLKLIGKHTQ
jgi:hypothetical protein